MRTFWAFSFSFFLFFDCFFDFVVCVYVSFLSIFLLLFIHLSPSIPLSSPLLPPYQQKDKTTHFCLYKKQGLPKKRIPLRLPLLPPCHTPHAQQHPHHNTLDDHIHGELSRRTGTWPGPFSVSFVSSSNYKVWVPLLSFFLHCRLIRGGKTINNNTEALHVHILNLTAQTGVFLFLQINSPPVFIYSPSSGLDLECIGWWMYNKTKSLSLKYLTSQKGGFTHLITESNLNMHTRRGLEWKLVGIISGFERWSVDWELLRESC